MPSSKGSSQPRDLTLISRFLHWQEDSLPLRHLGSQILYQTFKWPQILLWKKTRRKEIDSIFLPVSLSFLFSFELSGSPAQPLSGATLS